MTEAILIALLGLPVGGFIGFAFGGSFEERRQKKESQGTDGHEHTWEPWTEPKIDPLYEDGTRIGSIVTQNRACLACGYTDYRRDTYLN